MLTPCLCPEKEKTGNCSRATWSNEGDVMMIAGVTACRFFCHTQFTHLSPFMIRNDYFSQSSLPVSPDLRRPCPPSCSLPSAHLPLRRARHLAHPAAPQPQRVGPLRCPARGTIAASQAITTHLHRAGERASDQYRGVTAASGVDKEWELAVGRIKGRAARPEERAREG